jgi:hypothetical protein
MATPGDDDRERLYELCLEDIWRNGVSPLFKLVKDFLFCKSGVEERRSGFRGLEVDGLRAGDETAYCGGEPWCCSLGVFRGDFVGDDGGSGVSVALSRAWEWTFSERVVLVFVDEFWSVCDSSLSMDGRGTS